MRAEKLRAIVSLDSGVGVVATSGVLLAAVTAGRWALADPLVPVGLLYLVPILLLALRFAVAGGLAGVALACALTAVWIAVESIEFLSARYAIAAVTYTSAGLLTGWQVKRRRELERRLQELVWEDALTGIGNRRAWERRLSEELPRAAASGGTITVALLDLDDLKAVNDSDGHAAGDRLLVMCADGWRASLRPDDFIARLGGDEFAVLIRDGGERAVDGVVGRLRQAVPAGHTVSLGLARWDGQESSASLLRRADQALYAAKAALTG